MRYILKRLALVIPTLFAILTINFFIIQFTPGGPVEIALSKLRSHSSGDQEVSTVKSMQQHDSNLDPEVVAQIQKQYGFDQSITTRYIKLLKQYIMLDLGVSFYRDKKVSALLMEKLPVSITLGAGSFLLIYLTAIPLGIRKAVKNGSKFDHLTSFIVIMLYAVPSFLLAIGMITFFASGSFFSIFPLKGLTSDNFADLTIFGKICDYLWHGFLPVLAMSLGSIAGLTILCKNSFLEEISKNYVLFAKSKGLSPRQILYGHVFRNALLVVIAGLPAALLGIFFTGGLLVEIIFSLDGLGMLAFEAATTRDYPVIFGSLYLFTLLGLLVAIISDISYSIVDPRINFEAQNDTKTRS